MEHEIKKKYNKEYKICTNCDSTNHTYKKCPEPVTSWGIILIDCNSSIINHENKDIDLLKTDISYVRSTIDTDADRLCISNICNNLKFLMVSRKYSLGFVEFICGRYKPNKIDQVIYLFKQMKQSEINTIKKYIEQDNGFDYLWASFWGNFVDTGNLSKQKSISKKNYYILNKRGEDNVLGLQYIVDTVIPDYSNEDWGFPKGRREKNETTTECALREFEEETGYSRSDIKIIEHIKPLKEEFTGTNGINYRHVYYIAELLTHKEPISICSKNEIGSIRFIDFTCASDSIRDYHVARKNILEKVFIYYVDKIMSSNKSQE